MLDDGDPGGHSRSYLEPTRILTSVSSSSSDGRGARNRDDDRPSSAERISPASVLETPSGDASPFSPRGKPGLRHDPQHSASSARAGASASAAAAAAAAADDDARACDAAAIRDEELALRDLEDGVAKIRAKLGGGSELRGLSAAELCSARRRLEGVHSTLAFMQRSLWRVALLDASSSSSAAARRGGGGAPEDAAVARLTEEVGALHERVVAEERAQR